MRKHTATVLAAAWLTSTAALRTATAGPSPHGAPPAGKGSGATCVFRGTPEHPGASRSPGASLFGPHFFPAPSSDFPALGTGPPACDSDRPLARTLHLGDAGVCVPGDAALSAELLGPLPTFPAATAGPPQPVADGFPSAGQATPADTRFVVPEPATLLLVGLGVAVTRPRLRRR